MTWARLLEVQGFLVPEIRSLLPTSIFNMRYKQNPLLTKDIQLLPLSTTLKKMFAAAGFTRLIDFLELPYYQWQSRVPGLNHRYRRELVFFLLEANIDEFIKLK